MRLGLLFSAALLGSPALLAQPAGVTRRHAPDTTTEYRMDRAVATVRWKSTVPSRMWPALTRENLRKVAPLASAILPGSGQFVLGEDRFLVYSALEVGFWLRRANDEADRRRQERQFRAFARDVARSRFAGPHPDGDW